MRSELVPYAVSEKSGKGRLFAEEPHPYRLDFDRDRDRIIHCAAFRRLEGKTQVFTPGLDDHYRTRLTHTIEVAQIGRTIAKVAWSQRATDRGDMPGARFGSFAFRPHRRKRPQ